MVLAQKTSLNGIRVALVALMEDGIVLFAVCTANHEERFGQNQAEAWAWFDCIA